MRGISALLAIIISSLLAVPSHQASSYQSPSPLDELDEAAFRDGDRPSPSVLRLLSRLLAVWGTDDHPPAASPQQPHVAKVTQRRSMNPVTPEEMSFLMLGEDDAAADSRVGKASFGPLALLRSRVLQRTGKSRSSEPTTSTLHGIRKRPSAFYPQHRRRQFGRQRRYNPDIPCHFNPITCMDY